MSLRIIFIGETWQGSSARSMREALALQRDVFVTDIAQDHYLPRHRSFPLRIANRVFRPLQIRELEGAVMEEVKRVRPDAILVYKGVGIYAPLLKVLQSNRVPLINLFPDYSPHAYGWRLQKAMGCYDLVISTKSFHPPLWQSVYGYHNSCVFVPHGYDPQVHYWSEPSRSQDCDVALAATWRPEYHKLMECLAEHLSNENISIAIAGAGWTNHRTNFPSKWRFVGPQTGRAYGEFLRSAKIAIAPVNREVIIRGVRQPGDEDSTRTYELAAAHCFFLHQRTDYVSTVYDEGEVPLWSDAAELARLVRCWLPNSDGRYQMAAKAHARAVSSYSIPRRALRVLNHIEQTIKDRKSDIAIA